MSPTNGNGFGAVPDLGAVRARQQAKVAMPAYDAGTPELALQIGGPLVNGSPSFTDAIDNIALVLHSDGWELIEVKQCAVVGIDGPNGMAAFQVIVVARQRDVQGRRCASGSGGCRQAPP
jgi:hypothetical protein